MDNVKGLFGLVLLGFLETVALFIVSPILPQYAERFGASYFEIGFFFTAYSITWTILQLYTGYLSDRHGKKRFVFLGLLLYATFAFFIGFARTFTEIVAFRIMQGVGLGLFGPAALGLAAQFEEKGKSLAFYRTANSLGIVIGPLLGGVLGALDLSYPFFLCGLVSLIAIFSLRLLREERIETDRFFLRSAKIMFRNKRLLLICLAAFMAELCFAALDVIIPLVGSSLGFSSFWIGVILASYFLTFTLFQVPIGLLTKKFEKRKLVRATAIMGMFPFIILYLSRNVFEMTLAMGLLGVMLGTVFVQSSAMIAEISPKGEESMYMAFFDAIIDFSFPTMPMIVTYLAGFHIKAPFLLMITLMALSGVIFHLLGDYECCRVRAEKPF